MAPGQGFMASGSQWGGTSGHSTPTRTQSQPTGNYGLYQPMQAFFQGNPGNLLGAGGPGKPPGGPSGPSGGGGGSGANPSFGAGGGGGSSPPGSSHGSAQNLPNVPPRNNPDVVDDRIRKPNSELKPFTLTRDHSPVEFTQWLDQYEAYYTSSKMALATSREQIRYFTCLLYTSPSPRDKRQSRMPSSA